MQEKMHTGTILWDDQNHPHPTHPPQAIPWYDALLGRLQRTLSWPAHPWLLDAATRLAAALAQEGQGRAAEAAGILASCTSALHGTMISRGGAVAVQLDPTPPCAVPAGRWGAVPCGVQVGVVT